MVLRRPVRLQVDLRLGVVDLEAQNVGQLLNPRQDLLELPLVPSDDGHVINIDVELSLWEFAAEGAVGYLLSGDEETSTEVPVCGSESTEIETVLGPPSLGANSRLFVVFVTTLLREDLDLD